MALVRAAVPRYCIRDHLGELRRFSEAQDEGTERRQQNEKSSGTAPWDAARTSGLGRATLSSGRTCPPGSLAASEM